MKYKLKQSIQIADQFLNTNDIIELTDEQLINNLISFDLIEKVKEVKDEKKENTQTNKNKRRNNKNEE